MSVSLIDGHIDREKQTMTDNEIIKALECCSDTVNYQCNKCPLYVDCEKAVIAEYSLDLINRQKAEIERLKDCPKCVYEYDGEITEYCSQSPCPNFKTADEIKSEAVKECLEWVFSLFPEDKNFTTISRFTVNQKLKEMVGEG